MAKEFERKFLVSGGAWRKGADHGKSIRQAYLALTEKISLRVRILGGRAWLTIKSAKPGAARDEFEYPIPVKDARALMKLRTGHVISKRRHVVRSGNSRFEVDVFEGVHRGLVIAEIERPRGVGRIDRPEWLGPDVTHEPRYYNHRLALARSKPRANRRVP